MLVSLYTVRVVLNTLGAEDYGIYNVVGGVVILFSFLNSAMSSATQRFLNYALGQNNTKQARDVYSISVIIYLFLSIAIVVLAETVGLWFLKTQLNIPDGRRAAAIVVYQFSVVAVVVNILRVPYNATIIAYERMSFFALVSVIEVVLKLILVFLLALSPIDTLVFYSLLVFLVSVIIFFVYKLYCNRTFETAHFSYCNDKILFRQLISFSGWSIFGGFANVCNSQGTNILLNIFCGVTVNAAMSIATQVNSAVYHFVGNFQTAFNPQIVKSYAANEYDYFIRLIFQTSKISFFLLFFFVLPLYINADFVLQIWLKNVPEYTVIFMRIILITSLISAISGPLWMSIQATGNIKKYQIIVSSLIFANLPLAFLFLFLGFGPVSVLIIHVIVSVIIMVWRIFFLRERINLPVSSFFVSVLLPICIITFISSMISIFLYDQFEGLSGFVVSCCSSVICTSCLIYCIGLQSYEKRMVKKWIDTKLRKITGKI